MRELIVTQNITLDGVIDATEGWFSVAGDDVDQSDIIEAVREGSERSDALLVRALKAQPGTDIVTTGSMSLMPTLIGSGVVDEYRLFVYPVVIGRGQRLFADAVDVPPLQLVESRPFRSGVVLLRYRPT